MRSGIVKAKLANRLLLWIIPVSLVGIGVLGSSAYWISKRHIAGNIRKDIGVQGDQAGLALSNFFKQRTNDLKTILETPLLADYHSNRDFGLLQEAETYRREIERYLLRFSQRTGVYNRLAYLDERGVEICKAGPAARERRAGKEGVSAQDESFLEVNPRFGPQMVYRKPFFNQAGVLKGELVLECSLAAVLDILSRLNVGSSGWAYLTDETGRVLLGKAPDPAIFPGDPLTAQAPISETRWKVRVGAKASEFLAPLNQIRDLTIWIGGLCGILVVLFVVFRVRSLTRPIKDLVEAAKVLEAGDLSGRVLVQSRDEIGDLSKAFNTMAQSLQVRDEDLKSRIEENAALLRNLAESEARYRSLLENSPVAILGLTREHRIVTWNRGAERIFGHVSESVAGKPIGVLFPPDREEEFRNLLTEVMQKGSARDFAISGITREGRRLALSLSWGGPFPDFWMNKEWTLVIRDVTEARRLQEQIIRSEKLSAVGQLLSSIAHELNNPLQAVIGYAQLLSRSPKNTKEDLKMIVDNSMRCRKIIENLLLFVRHGEVEKRPVPVQKAVLAAIDLLKYKLAKSANISVHRRFPAGLPPVQADFQQIQQVFVNLINNACDALSGWEGSKELKIRARRMGGKVRVEFTDSGPGIPLEVQGRIFEPFYTTKPEGRGTGLGLSVCRQILEEHGGAIGFRSQPGQGAAFWVDLPLAAGKEKKKETEVPEVSPVQGKAVLIVDDESDVLAYLSRAVRLEGNAAETAGSFEEAMAKIQKKSYDLIVTDIRLGDGAGTDLFERWPEGSANVRPPFLFMTGDVLNAALEEAIEKKALPLLRKPVDLPAFQNAVRALLSGQIHRIFEREST